MFSQILLTEGRNNTSNIHDAAIHEGNILVIILPTGILITIPIIHRLTTMPSSRTNDRVTYSHTRFQNHILHQSKLPAKELLYEGTATIPIISVSLLPGIPHCNSGLKQWLSNLLVPKDRQNPQPRPIDFQVLIQ